MPHKNIWMLNHYAHGPEFPGGTRHYTLAKHLIARGHDVTILASDFHHSLKRHIRLQDGSHWAIEDIDGVRFVWLHTMAHQANGWQRIANMLQYMLRAAWLGPRLARREASIPKPDVVIGSSVHLFAVLAAWWIARRTGAHFVMEVRDLWPQTLIDMGALAPDHPLTRLLQKLERFLYHRAETIISLLPFAFRYMEKTGVPSGKVVWIPNGVDLELYAQASPEPPVQESVFGVIYAGAHGIANALEPLLEAFEILQQRGRADICLDLYGDGPIKERLISKAQKAGLAQVKFHDPVPKQALPDILAQAHATVIVMRDIDLYRYGISPNKTFDYLAAARPMILAGPVENNVVRDAQCGVSTGKPDPKTIADMIVRLADTPLQERIAMGERARHYVEEHHSFEVLTDRLESVINSL